MSGGPHGGGRVFEMETVAVTGGCGVAGRAVVRRLVGNENVKEIRILDRASSNTKVFSDAKVRHFQLELTDEGAVARALNGCTSVVHCAGPVIPATYQDKEEKKNMWRDSIDATEIVVDKMISRSVPRLVHVGDAFSALPIEDNYGLGEELFFNYPRNYLLGEYGEARTRAEMYARNAVKKNNGLHGIFLRPVHVHSEGTASGTMKQLIHLAKEGHLPFIPGDRRGMTQFIYADNLAQIVEKAIFGLAEDPERYSGEIVYCLDDTNLHSYRDFLESRVNNPNFSAAKEESFMSAWFSHYYNYIRHSLGLQVPERTLSYPMFRLIFEKTIGFSNKKVRLLMDFVPEVPQEKALRLSENVQEDHFEREKAKSG